MVDGQGPLQPIDRGVAVGPVAAGVVDQHVQPLVLAPVRLGGLADRGLGGQVGQEQLDPQVAGGRLELGHAGLAPGRIAGDQHQLGAQPAQPGGDRLADPGGGPGDQVRPAMAGAGWVTGASIYLVASACRGALELEGPWPTPYRGPHRPPPGRWRIPKASIVRAASASGVSRATVAGSRVM